MFMFYFKLFGTHTLPSLNSTPEERNLVGAHFLRPQISIFPRINNEYQHEVRYILSTMIAMYGLYSLYRTSSADKRVLAVVSPELP